MSKCDNCGRDDGHWLGCADAVRDRALVVTDDEKCSFDGCSEPRRSADKRVKFCDEHSDPKNRK